MKLAWVTDIHLNFLESADRKKFYQDVVATKSNAVLVSGDISEAPTVSDILEEMAQHKDYQPGKNQNALIDENMEKILNAYEARKEIEKYAHLASYDELKENDFNPNIPHYVDTFEEEAEIDIEAVQQEIDTLERELAEVRCKRANLLKEVAA